MLRRSVAVLALLTMAIAGLLEEGAVAGRDPGAKYSSSPQEAARKALDILRHMKFTEDAARFKDLGFESADELATADLGSGLPIFLVGLKGVQGAMGLKDFGPGSNPEELLVDTHRVIFPIMVKETGRVVSSLTTTQLENKTWRVTRRGSPNLIRRIQEYRNRKPGVDRVVWIPGLSLYFLGDRTTGKLMLIAIANNPEFRLKAGQELPAYDVFVKLAPEAVKVLAEEGLR